MFVLWAVMFTTAAPAAANQVCWAPPNGCICGNPCNGYPADGPWSSSTQWAQVGQPGSPDDPVPWPCPALWLARCIVPAAPPSGASDDAGFASGGTVTLDAGDVTLHQLDMNNGNASRTTITGTSGSITVQSLLNWPDGLFDIPSVHIAPGASVVLGNGPAIGATTTVVNDGTGTWAAVGIPSGFEIALGGKFVNNGVMDHDNPEANSVIGFPSSGQASGFDNLGTVNVNAGSLEFRALGVSTGPFNVASGATLTFYAYDVTALLKHSGPMSVAGTGKIVMQGDGGNSLETGFSATGTGTLELRPTVHVMDDVTVSTADIVGSYYGNLLDGPGTLTIASGSKLTWGETWPSNLGNGNPGDGNLTIASGATLDLQGSLGLRPGSRLTNNGTFDWVQCAQANEINIGGGAVLDNAGTLNYGCGDQRAVSGTGEGSGAFNNLGTINVDSGTLQVRIPFTMGPSSTVHLAGGSGLLLDLPLTAAVGTYSGTGTITAPSIGLAGAVLSPGASAGTLTISAALSLADNTALNYDLGTASDKIVVNGNLVLDGTLDVSAAPGIAAGTYTLIEYSGSLTDNGLAAGRPPAGFLVRVFVDSAAKKVMVELTPGVGILSGPLGALAAFLALALLLRFRSKVVPARARLV
ncbi:MAG: hypothetical protein HYV63_25345 [Candidatus Schekmanbacteria bacterium]|nr:hypothetical protein [Candidatus Schekmanbacteria bacterium]